MSERVKAIKRVGTNDEFMVLAGPKQISFFKILEAGKLAKTQVIQMTQTNANFFINKYDFRYIGGEYIVVHGIENFQFYSKKTGQIVKEFKSESNLIYFILPYTEGVIVNDRKNDLIVYK